MTKGPNGPLVLIVGWARRAHAFRGDFKQSRCTLSAAWTRRAHPTGLAQLQAALRGA